MKIELTCKVRILHSAWVWLGPHIAPSEAQQSQDSAQIGCQSHAVQTALCRRCSLGPTRCPWIRKALDHIKYSRFEATSRHLVFLSLTYSIYTAEHFLYIRYCLRQRGYFSKQHKKPSCFLFLFLFIWKTTHTKRCGGETEIETHLGHPRALRQNHGITQHSGLAAGHTHCSNQAVFRPLSRSINDNYLWL